MMQELEPLKEAMAAALEVETQTEKTQGLDANSWQFLCIYLSFCQVIRFMLSLLL